MRKFIYAALSMAISGMAMAQPLPLPPRQPPAPVQRNYVPQDRRMVPFYDERNRVQGYTQQYGGQTRYFGQDRHLRGYTVNPRQPRR